MTLPPALGVLTRLDLRRDRWLIIWWTIGNSLLFVSQGWSVDRLYASQQEFDAAAVAMAENTAFIALAGPARALNSTGGQVAWQAGAYGAIVAGLMSMLIVIRHTRAEEEAGRDELVRAGAVGRPAPLLAAAATMSLANAVMGAGITASLLAYGLPAAGSVALGLGTAACGLVFGAAALVAAQLFGTSRAAYGAVGVFIAVSYALRAVGDITGGVLSWASPIGWAQAMRAYADERWWPLALLLVLAGALLALSIALFGARDAGTGVLTTSSPGPAHAGRTLGSPLGLAWHLERTAVAGWAISMGLGGLLFGSVGDDVDGIVGTSDLSRDLFGTGTPDAVDQFYAVVALILALLSCGFAIAAVHRADGDEASGVAEQLLTTGLTRRRWGVSILAVALGGSAIVVAAAGIGLGVGLALSTGDLAYLPSLAAATALQGAGVVFVACAAWLAFGLHRASGPWAWSYLAYVLVVALFTDVLGLPRWATALSPFTHLPAAPAESFAVLPTVAVLVASGVLAVAGLRALDRRDLG